MCLFARKPYAVGDEILREEPLVVLDAINSLHITDEHHIQHLSPEKSTAIWQLSDSSQGASHRPPTLPGIIRTNCIPLTRKNESKDESGRGLFALTCRINHACAGASNARFVWRHDLQVRLKVFQMCDCNPPQARGRCICEGDCLYACKSCDLQGC